MNFMTDLNVDNKVYKPKVLFADKKGSVSGHLISISPEETLVIE
jgi:hypothetical protein